MDIPRQEYARRFYPRAYHTRTVVSDLVHDAVLFVRAHGDRSYSLTFIGVQSRPLNVHVRVQHSAAEGVQ